MPDHDASLLARYEPWRRRAEVGFWVAVVGLQAVFNSVVTWMDLRRVDPGFPYGLPALWEATSALVAFLLIPALVAFEKWAPLSWRDLRRLVPWYVLASIAFSLVHTVGMVLLRKAAYLALDAEYHVRDWGATLFYEYLKDVRSFVMIIAALWTYRFVLLRLQGEARVLDAPDAAAGEPDAPPPVRPERFLVRKLRKEFLIAAQDIEWLQAQGNYVGLHVNGHDYLLRSTLAGFLEQLDPARFVQVHRSYAVNLDRIAEIEPTDGGDAKLKMKDGTTVPCSRRYRDALAVNA